MGKTKKTITEKLTKTQKITKAADTTSQPEQDVRAEYIQFTNLQKGDLKIPSKGQLNKYKIPETDLAIDQNTLNLTAKLPDTRSDELTLSLTNDSLIILSNNKKNAYFTEIKFPELIIPQSAVAKLEFGTLHLNVVKNQNSPEPWDGLLQIERIQELQKDANEAKERLSQFQKQYHTIQQEYQGLLVRSKKEIENKVDSYKILVIEKLLKNIDNFELALQSATNDKGKKENSEQIIVGITLILNELRNMIKDEGVNEIASEGCLLDPLQHEVLDCEETDKYPENTILKVYQKGYKYKSRVIRPSKVRVSIPLKSAKKKK